MRGEFPRRASPFRGFRIAQERAGIVGCAREGSRAPPRMNAMLQLLLLSSALCAASCQNPAHRSPDVAELRVERVVVEQPQSQELPEPGAPFVQRRERRAAEPRTDASRGPRAQADRPRARVDRSRGQADRPRAQLDRSRGRAPRADARQGLVCPHCGAPLPPHLRQRFVPHGQRGLRPGPRGARPQDAPMPGRRGLRGRGPGRGFAPGAQRPGARAKFPPNQRGPSRGPRPAKPPQQPTDERNS